MRFAGMLGLLRVLRRPRYIEDGCLVEVFVIDILVSLSLGIISLITINQLFYP